MYIVVQIYGIQLLWLTTPNKEIQPSEAFSSAKLYFAGPDNTVDFAVDDTSVIAQSCDCSIPPTTEEIIDQYRKGDINIEWVQNEFFSQIYHFCI